MTRRSKKNKVFAGQMGLDLQFFDAATRKALIDQAAIEVAEKDVTYASLEAAIDSLKLPETNPDIGFDLKILDTDKKLDINKLGERTKKVIVEVAQHSSLVEKFISERAKQANDPSFPQRLRYFFVSLYNKFYLEEETYGDELFEAVRQAASQNAKSASCKFAIVAILVHLFIICDVFLRQEDLKNAASK